MSDLATLLRLIWREIYDQVRSPRFLVPVLAVAAIAPLTIYVSARDYRVRARHFQQLVDQRTADRARLGGVAMGWDAEPGLRALRAPAPASVLVNGLDRSLPTSWEFTPAGV